MINLYVIGSVIDKFPEFHDREYTFDVVCTYNGSLLYQLYDEVNGVYFEHNEHTYAYDTKHLCHMLKLSEELTMLWVLRFGDTLPKHVSQL